jgi:ribonucleoside-diphosphate reductase alpha chain
MAIAPTATISYIQGCSPSIDPDFSTFFVYENKSGNLFITNEWFVKECKELGIWNNKFREALKMVDGDVNLLSDEVVPSELKCKYKTAFDQDQFKLVDCAAARQKWIDMGQSLNLFNNSTSLKYLNDLYFHAKDRGLKSTYYLRNKSASKIEKSTSTQTEQEPKACSILDPDCESCQ